MKTIDEHSLETIEMRSVIGSMSICMPKLVFMFGMFWIFADRELNVFFKSVKNRKKKVELQQVLHSQQDYILVVKKE